MDGSQSEQERSVAPGSLPGPATGLPRVRSQLVPALLVVALAGLALAAPVAWQLQQGWHAGQHQRLMLALAAGAAAAAATALGSLPALFARSYSQRGFDCFLGFGAGVMLAATAFSLLVPALASAGTLIAGRTGASLLVALGLLTGVAAITGLDRLAGALTAGGEGSKAAPATAGAGAPAASLRRVWLFMAAVTLHNVPEGLAIGVAYAGIDLDKAATLATGIAVQDLPEGLVIALAFRSVDYRRLRATALGMASGLVEPVASLAGVLLVGMSVTLLPLGLAAAAGAMLFVIVNEVVPETHLHGNGTLASCALAAGFAAMLVLDTALGELGENPRGSELQSNVQESAIMDTVDLDIYRYDPESEQPPRMQRYSVPIGHGERMLLDVLMRIKGEIDDTLSFRRSCREGVCGSDGMNINGRNGLACLTNLREVRHPIVLRPLPGMPVVRDLIVDLSSFWRQYHSIQPFLVNHDPPPERERLQSPEQREHLNGLYECILCACCSSSCPSFWWNPDKFVGPAGLLQAYRFIADSRDQATAQRLDDLDDVYRLFRCRTIMNCADVCPKGLSPAAAIGDIRSMLARRIV